MVCAVHCAVKWLHGAQIGLDGFCHYYSDTMLHSMPKTKCQNVQNPYLPILQTPLFLFNSSTLREITASCKKRQSATIWLSPSLWSCCYFVKKYDAIMSEYLHFNENAQRTILLKRQQIVVLWWSLQDTKTLNLALQYCTQMTCYDTTLIKCSCTPVYDKTGAFYNRFCHWKYVYV